MNSSKQLNKGNPPSIILNREQLNALSSLNSIPSTTKLLHGITGSGKTNIYLELARNTLEKNQSVIILVPEIALTPQLVSIFEATFKQQVITIHSQLTESERHQIWEDILLSPKDSPHIVLGARSALFAPLKNLVLMLLPNSDKPFSYPVYRRHSDIIDRPSRALPSWKVFLDARSPLQTPYADVHIFMVENSLSVLL